jgi:thiol-disulfide isomerase/thioredoxin
MASASSTTLSLGAHRPPVRLVNALTGSEVDFDAQAAGKRGSLVMFLCNHCPYVVHVRKELLRVAHEAIEKGVAVVAINSNDKVAYPQDGPPAMAALAREEKWQFAFLFDETQDVARAFDAQCTPDLYLFDAAGKLAYHGQLDDSRPSNGKPVTGRDLRAAIDTVVAGKPVEGAQAPCIGCSIKWK